MTSKSAFRKIIHLSFPPEHSGSPVMSQLVRKYDLTFNILKGKITPRKEGYLTVHIEGLEKNWNEALNYLKSQRITAVSAAQHIARDEKKCMHCGLCTAMCPAGALSNDRISRKVLFNSELCTACGMCTKVCPVAAMQADLDQDNF